MTRHDKKNTKLRRAIFFDRDGVINKPVIRNGKPYPPDRLEDLEIYPEAAEACRLLKEAGFLLVVVTNQPDVRRGRMNQSAVEAIHNRLRSLLPVDSIEISYAMNDEEPDSFRRKPQPGMLLEAAQKYAINLSQSFMLGDRWRDVNCGHAAGCVTIFIDRGYKELLDVQPDFRASHILEAAKIILANQKFAISRAL